MAPQEWQDQPPQLVAFDCDGVLATVRSSWAIVHAHYQTDNRPSLEAFRRGEIDVVEFIRRDVALWKAVEPTLTPERLQSDVSPAMVPMDGARQVIQALQRAGSTVVCISGGLDLLVHPLAVELGIHSENIYANGLRTDGSGILDGRGTLRVSPRRKDRVLQPMIEMMKLRNDQVAAIGDTAQDTSMFLPGVRSIAFNPADTQVVQQARHVERRTDLRHIATALGVGDAVDPPR